MMREQTHRGQREGLRATQPLMAGGGSCQDTTEQQMNKWTKGWQSPQAQCPGVQPGALGPDPRGYLGWPRGPVSSVHGSARCQVDGREPGFRVLGWADPDSTPAQLCGQNAHAPPPEMRRRSYFPGRGEGSISRDWSKGPASCSARTRVHITGARRGDATESGRRLAGLTWAGQVTRPGHLPRPTGSWPRRSGGPETDGQIPSGKLPLRPVVGDKLLGAGQGPEGNQPPS